MLNLIQLIVAILLIVTILLQQRGSGLGAAFGGESSVYRTKRGAEKTIFTATIILVVLFLGLALVNVYLTTKTPDQNQPDIENTNQETEGETETEGEEALDNQGNPFEIDTPENSQELPDNTN
ncbi:preprotein translocase subunit SecG [Candidatus Falkowbacteria bacterium]|nr:preprotein translocase subunit SecG [Candidatus Falkowbacteria bacterium]